MIGYVLRRHAQASATFDAVSSRRIAKADPKESGAAEAGMSPRRETGGMEYSNFEVEQLLGHSTLQQAFVAEALQQVQHRREREGRGLAPWTEDDLEAAQAEVNFMIDQETEEQLAKD
jgi:hypothetical protein